MSKSKGTHKKAKIALAPLLGFVAGLIPGLMYAHNSGTYWAEQGGTNYWDGLQKGLMFAYLGVTQEDGKWTFKAEGMANGLVPLVGLSLLGWGAHKMAVKFDVNRHIPWVSI